MPRGYSGELLNQELIRYKGLKCWFQIPLPEEVYSQELVSMCYQYYQQLLPLFEWMVSVLSCFSLEEYGVEKLDNTDTIHSNKGNNC